MANDTIKTSFSGELYRQFSWFDKVFTQTLSKTSAEFFFEGLEYKLIGLSVNMNVLTQSESFFVTKVCLDEKNEIYVRLAQDTIRIMLDKILGKMSKRKFDLSKLTDLEAKIITAFNNAVYKNISSNLDASKIAKDKDIINLSYNVRNTATNESGKMVISMPKAALTPETILSSAPTFQDRYFKNSLVDVNIKLGVINFSVIDVKKLDVGDLVVFENSQKDTMTLICEDIIQEFKVVPDETRVVSFEDINGGNEMDQNVNLWDSIQVEMSAEFDKVKISLGELKDIEEGQVVDISSVYNNKVSLKVGDKTIAKGELVIINDRYGVKINTIEATQVNQENHSEFIPQDNDMPQTHSAQSENGNDNQEQNDEEFDYSDFELDEQDI